MMQTQQIQAESFRS